MLEVSTTHLRGTHSGVHWTRRQFLKRAAVVGVSVPAAVGLLAAPATPSAPATGASPVAPTPAAANTSPTVAAVAPTTPSAATVVATGSGGIINIAATGGDKGIMNPLLVGADIWATYLTFNRLLLYEDVGTLQPELAQNGASQPTVWN